MTVKNLDTAKAKVTWGDQSMEFTKEQLAAGVNLAAEFRKTPFDQQFLNFTNAIAQKQDYETNMIKGMVTNFRSFAGEVKDDAEFAGALEVLKKKMLAKQEKLGEASLKQLPAVKHTITVTPVQ